MESKIYRHMNLLWSHAKKEVDYKNIKIVRDKARELQIRTCSYMSKSLVIAKGLIPLTDLISPTVGTYLLYPVYKRGTDGSDPTNFKEVAAFRIISDSAYFKYFVLSDSRLVGTNDFNFALHMCWFLGTVSTVLDQRVFDDYYVDHWLDQVQMQIDQEYNEVVQSTEDIPVQIPVEPFDMHRIEDEGNLDKKLYEHFCQSMNHLRKTGTGQRTYSTRMGDTKVHSAVINLRCAHINVHRHKRQLTPAQWLEASDRVCVLASQFPKVGSLRSDGKMRMVCAPHPTLEAWQRYYWDGISPKSFCEYVPSFKDIRKDLKYSYDIKTMDNKAGPYFRRWLREFEPKNENKQMPLLIHKRRIYRTLALPSGVVHTAIVGNAFSHAVARRMGLTDFQIQGDGILTNRPCAYLDWLSRKEDYSLNGFKTSEGCPQFINTSKLTKAQYVRSKGLVGKNRYAVRYGAYRILNARGLDDRGPDGKRLYPLPTVSLTAQEVELYVKQYASHLDRAEKIAYSSILTSYSCRENDETACFPEVTAVHSVDGSTWEQK